MSEASKAKFLVCVDAKDHSRVALRFACMKAQKTGSKVELIYVIDPADFNTFQAVAEQMEGQKREQAEALVNKLAEEAFSWAGLMPSIILRQGVVSEEIIKTVEDDGDINMLVLGAAPDGSSTKNRILTTLTGQMGDKIHIPLLIVPGDLTDKQIMDLT